MSDWDKALEAAAQAVRLHDGEGDLAEQILAMQGELNKEIVLEAMAKDDAELEEEVRRGLFTNVEAGLMIDHGDGNFSLSEKGKEHVEKLLGGEDPMTFLRRAG